MKIPNAFYRVSVKALILNDEKKFLLSHEKKGIWDILGGGLDHGENANEGLVREIQEETGLEVTYIASRPVYFLTVPNKAKDSWVAQIFYEVKLKKLNFIESEECVELRFFSVHELTDINVTPNVTIFSKIFNPDNHE